MPALETDRRRRLRNLAIVLALVGLSALCTALLQYRVHHTGSLRYTFMTWNLVLAWVPLAAALAADAAGRRRGRASFLLLLPAFAVWLAFLPNAPYLCTDLIHLHRPSSMPFWFDETMMTGYGVTGVLIGLASMLFMQDVARRLLGNLASWLIVALAAVLAAFGIYLGRFERLNSWDVFSSPSIVVRESWSYLRDPVTYSHALAFTVLFSAFLLAAYLCLFGVTERGSRLLLTWVRARRTLW